MREVLHRGARLALCAAAAFEFEWAEARDAFNDFGALDPERATLPRNTSALVVLDETGEAIGSVSWRMARYGPNFESRVWNIGIELVSDARGRGFGSEAQRLLAEYLFATTPVNRVEASTDVENIAEQRALEKAGFVREGILRGAQFRQGEWHDLVSYSMVRADLERGAG